MHHITLNIVVHNLKRGSTRGKNPLKEWINMQTGPHPQDPEGVGRVSEVNKHPRPPVTYFLPAAPFKTWPVDGGAACTFNTVSAFLEKSE